jgi:transposase
MPPVVRGYKTELDLNNEQRTACLKHAGASRFAYNWGLARSQEVYRTTGKRPSPMELHKELNAKKQTDFPWMYEVSKCAPQGEIKRQLLYKTVWSGVFLVLIDRFHPSSKKCSCCGWINEELTLSDRVFVCLDCSYVADRDDNAAKNILAQALRPTESSSESYACGERSAALFRRTSETALAEAGTRPQLGVSSLSKF